ncbi:MAG: hypothetical protein RIB63_19595, partial [Fulvivirga sp.]
NMGALLSIVNAFTEKADTRNWQTLPHDISYGRVPLDEGTNKFKLVTQSHSKDNSSYDFIVDGNAGQTVFQVFSSLESSPPSSLY